MMEAAVWHAVLGYVASLGIVISLSMRSILKLRLFGVVGSGLFLVYSLLIGAIPIAVTNVVIIAIHLYYLRKLLGRNELFEVLRVRPESFYLLHFLEFHDAEIQRFQPGFEYQAKPACRPLFLLRDMVPAGLFIPVTHEDGSVEVWLDYATPQYRDFKLGRYVYGGTLDVFGQAETVWSEPWSDVHRRYLEKMDFVEAEREGRTILQRSVSLELG